jgi:hypothetical protein
MSLSSVNESEREMAGMVPYDDQQENAHAARAVCTSGDKIRGQDHQVGVEGRNDLMLVEDLDQSTR